jgi:muramoyltetrapeptide carboxypeptidase
MITPPYLKQGDTVGIVAPAKWIEQKYYNPIIDFIEQKGYTVLRGRSTYEEYGPFAGSDSLRLEDMQQMINNRDIATILCLRGGYGTIRIINDLDFGILKTHPKWIVGFSDITILHNALSNNNIESIHGQMPINFTENIDSAKSLFNALKGNGLNYTLKPDKLNKTGIADGILTGGNIAILCSLIGTDLDVNWDNKILFIEDVGEYLYRFDRLIHQLKLSGKLKKITGLIVGGLSSMKDNTPSFGQTAQEIIYNAVKEYNYPVCFNFPAGHISNNNPLIMGRMTHMEVDNNMVQVKF